MISFIQANNTGTINAEDWEKGDRLKSVALLIAYLDKANFYVMEDSGAWEEDARLNTSSVALVTSGDLWTGTFVKPTLEERLCFCL